MQVIHPHSITRIIHTHTYLLTYLLGSKFTFLSCVYASHKVYRHAGPCSLCVGAQRIISLVIHTIQVAKLTTLQHMQHALKYKYKDINIQCLLKETLYINAFASTQQYSRGSTNIFSGSLSNGLSSKNKLSTSLAARSGVHALIPAQTVRALTHDACRTV